MVVIVVFAFLIVTKNRRKEPPCSRGNSEWTNFISTYQRGAMCEIVEMVMVEVVVVSKATLAMQYEGPQPVN